MSQSIFRLTLATLLLIQATAIYGAVSDGLEKSTGTNSLDVLVSAAANLRVTHDVLKSLASKECSNFDAIREIYNIFDLEADENTKFFTIPRTNNEALAYLDEVVSRTLKQFQDLNSKCSDQGRGKFSGQTIPQDVKDIIMIYRGNGNIILSLTTNCPNDRVVNAVGDIMAQLVRGLNGEKHEGARLMDLYLAKGTAANEEMVKLEQECRQI